jgi:hypothetical protein
MLSARRGGFEEYAVFFHLSPAEAAEVGSLAFRVDVRGSFNSLLSGHPEMRSVQRWTDQIASGLQLAFDEQGFRERARDRFMVEALEQTERLVGGGTR